MSFHNGFLPREGFCADTLGVLLKQTLLNPLATVPLYLLGRFTEGGQSQATEHATAGAWLKWLSILGSLRVLNNWLSRRAINNGVADTYDWTKEIVLITGGSDGIGKSIALMLASRDIRVVVLDIQPLTYDPPPTLTFHTCDITSTPSITSVASDITSTLGAPTVLINNAGVCRGKPLLSNTDTDLELTFAVNTLSHYKLARAFLPAMIASNHGMVVTMASSASWVTAPRMTEYAASKAAALAFHEGIAAELVATYHAPRVRTVVVNQGYTRTSLFQGFGADQPWLVPPLHVDTVAQAVVEQVLSGTSGQIILPGTFKLLAAHFRSLPDWYTHAVRVDLRKLMRDWRGRQVEVPMVGGEGKGEANGGKGEEKE
ncbi:MAG: hypothetical protein M1828_003635 [Chrysothrix sp. TS-e1954]|nr:MAG: hypothetical protein M1828_003635 [Chrysothrix sp. TS-e1954]